MKLLDRKVLTISIAILLFLIPFFWLKPGEMDLGGDSNRLYFYDPLSNLFGFAMYSVGAWGTGIVVYNQYFIPYLLFLSFLKFIFVSPTILIDIFNGLKLSCSFIFVFLIVKELLLQKDLKKELTIGEWCSAIMASLVYTFSSAVLDNMKYALITHDHVFLNPLIFYLLLRYVITLSIKYIWIVLFITFIFSSSFSLYGPPLYAFYPLTILFLLLYNAFVLKKSFPWKGFIIGVLFFLGLHAFHIFPVVSNVFDTGSEFNRRVFESRSNVNAGLIGFTNILSAGKVSEHILLPLEVHKQNWGLLFIPMFMILGFLFLRKKDKTLLLISIFFFITLFLVSANITYIGVEFYKKLFYIPGFGMFRNFYGHWQFVYTFFYSLLVGLTLAAVFIKLKKKYIIVTIIFIITLLMIRSEAIFNGEIIDTTHRTSKNVKVTIQIDPHYEKMLSYLKQIPDDGKILHMPFTDYAYNIVGGKDKGTAYIGQSMPSFIAGKNDFAGYQNIDPFSEVFVKLVKEKNYAGIKQMMSLLQIRYILYNSDETVSNTYFPAFPYGYTGVPTFRDELQRFVESITSKKKYKIGTYTLYEVDKNDYLPHFYVAKDVFLYNTNPTYDTQYSKASSFFPTNHFDNNEKRIAFLDREICDDILSNKTCDKRKLEYERDTVKIIYQRINPTKYKLEIQNASKPFLLVFQQAYSTKWKIHPVDTTLDKKNKVDSYFGGEIIELAPNKKKIDSLPFETFMKPSIYKSSHIEINGYANAWYIDPQKLSPGDKNKFGIIIEVDSQRFFYFSLIISLVTLGIFLLYGIKIFRDRL